MDFLKNLSLPLNFSVEGKKDIDLLSKQEAKENEELDKTVLMKGEKIIREDFIPGSRKKKWGIISKKPIYDDNNRIMGIISSFTDITERKKSELKREVLEANINLVDECVWISNKDGKYIFINKAVEDVYGYPLGEIENRIFWEDKCLHPDYLAEWRRHEQANNYPLDFSFKIVRSDGEERWIESKTNQRIINGKEYIFTIEWDITQSRQDRLFNLITHTFVKFNNDFIWVFNKDNRTKLEFFIGSPTQTFGRLFNRKNALEVWENEILDKTTENNYNEWLAGNIAMHEKVKSVAESSSLNEFVYDETTFQYYRTIKPDSSIAYFSTETFYLYYLGSIYHISVERDITEKILFQNEVSSIRELLKNKKGDLSEAEQSIKQICDASEAKAWSEFVKKF